MRTVCIGLCLASLGCSSATLASFDDPPVSWPSGAAHVGSSTHRCHLDDSDMLRRVDEAAAMSAATYPIWAIFPDRSDRVPDVFPGADAIQAVMPDGWTYLDHFLADYATQGFAVLAAKGQRCVLAFKGTTGLREWKRDLDSSVLTECATERGRNFGKCGFGFFRIHRGLRGPDVRNAGARTVRGRIMVRSRRWARSEVCARGFTVTGHSLGGALSDIFVANYLRRYGDVLPSVTFAAPRAFGTRSSAILHRKIGDRKLRIIRRGDLVPNVPSQSGGFRHFGRAFELSQAMLGDERGRWYLWHYEPHYMSEPGPYHNMTAYRDGINAACSQEGEFTTSPISAPRETE